MKLTLNREYATRHLFTTVLMLALGGWFGYDGFVRYPAMPAAELYKSIEGREASENYDLEAFKRQKIKTQYGFTLLSLAAAAIVGLRLLKSARFRCEFDETGYTVNGVRKSFSEVKAVDKSKWQFKGIVKVDGVAFDSWHHLGVKDFVGELKKAGKI